MPKRVLARALFQHNLKPPNELGGRGAEHGVLDDPAWEATPLLRELEGTAHARLGTSG